MTSSNHSWVLITGASSGFGEEFARQYAAQGHSLVLVARRLDRLQALAETLRQQYRSEIVVEQVDLSDIAAITQLHRRLRERGIAIDILINNAGHGLQGPFVDSSLEASMAMVQLDVASLLAYQGVQNFAVYDALPRHVGHRLRRHRTAEADARLEAVDDAASTGCARRHRRLAGGSY